MAKRDHGRARCLPHLDRLDEVIYWHANMACLFVHHQHNHELCLVNHHPDLWTPFSIIHLFARKTGHDALVSLDHFIKGFSL